MKKKSVFLFAGLLVGLCFTVFGQSKVADLGSYKQNFIEGNKLLAEENRRLALEYFKLAYKYDSLNANINFNMGFCYLYHPRLKHEAEKYLEEAIKNVNKNYSEENWNEKGAPPLAYFYLAHAYHLDAKFDLAEKMLDTYETFLHPKDKEGHEEITYQKKMIKYARQNMAAPINVKIKNLGDSVNSEYPEYSPVISADERTIIYTHRGKTNVGGSETDLDGLPFEDIVISHKDDKGHWSKPTSIGPYINTIGHEASVSLTPDGQTLILYRADNGGDLYFSTWDGNEWGFPQKFGSNINTPYWENHACLSRDGNTLYFVSDRQGGFGGSDIYRCVKLPNGQWSLAQNLGKNINTPYNEDAPYISPDGITFYFASQGHESMGGLDIMFSFIGEDGTYSSPLNLGYPINTTDDDAFLVASPDNKRFYYASAHEDPNAYGEKDLYMITYEDAVSNPLALFKGQIKPGPCDSLPEDLVVLVTAKESGELIGTYRPQRKTGTFSVIIPPGSKYNFSYQQNGQEIFNEDVFVSADIAYEEIEKALSLKPHNLCNGALMDVDSAKTVDISFQLQVLSNKRDKKNISDAAVKIFTKEGVLYEGKTDGNGKLPKLTLDRNLNYEVNIEKDGKKATMAFNTLGVKENKTIEKVAYLEKIDDEHVKLTLNVLVLSDLKGKKPVKNANVHLVGEDGFKYDGVTDATGRLKGVKLEMESSYELTASSGEQKSTKNLVSTHGVRKSKSFEEKVYLQGEQETNEIPDNSELVGTRFKFYFKYNMNELDQTAPEFKQFVDSLLLKAKLNNGKLKLKFTCSASYVPTSKFKDNRELAELRLKKTEDVLLRILAHHGIGKDKITIVKEKAMVSGPQYKNDLKENQAVYEKYQYAEIEGL